jgi:hypothetical protein
LNKALGNSADVDAVSTAAAKNGGPLGSIGDVDRVVISSCINQPLCVGASNGDFVISSLTKDGRRSRKTANAQEIVTSATINQCGSRSLPSAP